MKNFLYFILNALKCNFGVTTYNGDIYAGSVADPIEKAAPGEMNSRLKVLYEGITLEADLAIGDIILGPKIPEGAIVVDALMLINRSMGTAGKLTLGHLAGVNVDGDAIAADPNAFILDADAGGQAVLARPLVGAILGKNLGKIGIGGLQTEAVCTEASDAITAVNTVLVEWFITYMLVS